MKRSFPTPRNRAVRMRHLRRRLYLQDGVLSVRFITFLEEQPEPLPARPPCEVKGCQEEANYHYYGNHYCWQHRPSSEYWVNPDPVESAEEWAASLDMPSPPWPSPEQEEEEEEEEFDYSELEPDVGPFPSFYTHDRLPWE